MSTMTLTDFFNDTFEPEFIDDAQVDYRLAQLAGRLIALVEDSGLSRREIARRMGHKSPSAVQRLVTQGRAHNATAETLIRLAAACEHRLVITFEPSTTATTDTPVVPDQIDSNITDLSAYGRAPDRTQPRWETPTRQDHPALIYQLSA